MKQRNPKVPFAAIEPRLHSSLNMGHWHNHCRLLVYAMAIQGDIVMASHWFNQRHTLPEGW